MPVDSLLRTDFKAVDKRDELRTVMGWLSGDSPRVPVVLDGAKPFGIVNERAVMSRKLEQRAKIETYTLATRAVPLNASLAQAAERMAEFRAAYVPVENAKEACAGYVTALDVARDSEMTKRARDLALPVQTLRDSQSLGEALHLFAQEYVDVLPVTSNGRIVGTLPRRQVVRMELQSGDKGRKDAGGERLHLLKDPVSGFMEDLAITISPGASYSQVVEALDAHGYAIVQESGGPVLGMITPETLMRSGVEWASR